MWANIPEEMRKYRSWVGADLQGRPFNPLTKQLADVTDPSTWGTFEEATAAGYPYIGFVFSDADPFSGIDLDDKADHPATPEQKARHQKIIEVFDSYTERSRSGRGYHIIVKGKVPAAAKKDNVEVYSRARYFIMTGNVVAS